MHPLVPDPWFQVQAERAADLWWLQVQLELRGVALQRGHAASFLQSLNFGFRFSQGLRGAAEYPAVIDL